jgi:predicted  nucleic acid-binding Zn-ribbon protein
VALPLMGSVAPGADMAGQQQSSPDQARQQLEQVMQRIRDLGQQVDQVGSQVPAFEPEIKQIRQILKRMIVKAAQAAPQQTTSSEQVPTAGS